MTIKGETKDKNQTNQETGLIKLIFIPWLPTGSHGSVLGFSEQLHLAAHCCRCRDAGFCSIGLCRDTPERTGGGFRTDQSAVSLQIWLKWCGDPESLFWRGAQCFSQSTFLGFYESNIKERMNESEQKNEVSKILDFGPENKQHY